MLNSGIAPKTDCWILLYSNPKAVIPDKPCSDCARIWGPANLHQRLRFLQVLQPRPLPPLQGVARRHLQEKHGINSLGLKGVGGVWLCGVFSGLAFSEGTTGSNFAHRIGNEVEYRVRLTRQTLRNITKIHRLLRTAGILTDGGISEAAVRLRASGDLEFARLGEEFLQTISCAAFEYACRTVKPT